MLALARLSHDKRKLKMAHFDNLTFREFVMTTMDVCISFDIYPPGAVVVLSDLWKIQVFNTYHEQLRFTLDIARSEITFLELY